MYVFQAPRWDAVVYHEWGDSSGWAEFIWQSLLERYCDNISGITPRRGRLFDSRDWYKLWEQEKDIPFEPWERNVLRATYDRAIIRGLTPLARIAGELRRFQKEYWRSRYGLCHVASVGQTIERLLFEMGDNWRPTAIGFQATSSAQELWRIPTGHRDETRPYNEPE